MGVMNLKVAVTGHRPERLNDTNRKSVEYWLDGIMKTLRACYDELELISGMAQGVDQIAAVAAVNNGVGLRCYLPYKRKGKHIPYLVQFLFDSAIEVKYINEDYSGNQCYIERDRRMVDDCDLLIVVWDGIKFGGTYETYRYAAQKGKNMLIYPWKN